MQQGVVGRRAREVVLAGCLPALLAFDARAHAGWYHSGDGSLRIIRRGGDDKQAY